MLSNFYTKIWSEAYSKNDQNIKDLLEYNPKARVLDVGCGDGKKTVDFLNKIGTKNGRGWSKR